jgi:hypothetical protein
MNHTFRLFTMLSMVSCLGFGIVACTQQEPPKPIISDTGRPETRSVEAANAVGYNGTAMRQKLDKALDANDAKNQDLNQVAEQ